MVKTFLYGGMARTGISYNVFEWPKSHGGLGLICPKIKSKCSKLKRIKQYLDRSGENENWENNSLHILMRFHIDNIYRQQIDPSLRETNVGNISQCLNEYYKGEHFYKNLFDTIVDLSVIPKYGKTLEQINEKWCYDAMIFEKYNRERYTRENWINLDIWNFSIWEEKRLWMKVFHNYLNPKTWAFGWKITHGILPVKTRILKFKKITYSGGKCLFCLSEDLEFDETIEHLLIECSLANKIWDKVNLAISKAGLRKIAKNPNEIIGRINQDIDENYILTETCYVLWLMRNIAIYDQKKGSWQQGLAMIRNKMNLMFALDSKSGKKQKWNKLQHFIQNLGVT